VTHCVHGSTHDAHLVCEAVPSPRESTIATIRAVHELQMDRQSELRRDHWDGCETSHPFCAVGILLSLLESDDA
jgi:hypothetical protein